MVFGPVLIAGIYQGGKGVGKRLGLYNINTVGKSNGKIRASRANAIKEASSCPLGSTLGWWNSQKVDLRRQPGLHTGSMLFGAGNPAPNKT